MRWVGAAPGNGTVAGGGNDFEISCGYVKITTGRNAIVRDTMTLPSTGVVTYRRQNTGGLHDLAAGRVTDVYFGSVARASYKYNGVDHVVGIDLEPIDVMSNQFGTTSGTYTDLDRFNRRTHDEWTKDLSTDVEFYSVDVAFDRASNITSTDELIFGANSYGSGKDIKFSIDGLNRMYNAQWGTLSGGSIGTETRERYWTLSHTGNWDYNQLDLNNDGVFTGAGEYNDHRTHNLVNELTERDTDNNGTPNYYQTLNKKGDMTDDGKFNKLKYDGLGRLTEIKNQSNVVVAEFKYNGLGHMIGRHDDTDGDGTVESSSQDPWYWFAYDDQWRIVATFREGDSQTRPKEQFVYHNAGYADVGASSSYIDTVVLRDRDMTNGWSGSADGTLEERVYYCQNWRADVVALIDSSGRQVQQVRYGEYGEAFGLPRGDMDGDGDINGSSSTDDTDQIQTWINTPTYDVRGDLDLDGDVQSDDKTAALAMAGTTLGWSALSLSIASTNGGNRKGYAGYELEPTTDGAANLSHVRNRVYHALHGRWLTRDPIGYADGTNLYESFASNPVRGLDPSGLDLILPPEIKELLDKKETAKAPGSGLCPPQLQAARITPATAVISRARVGTAGSAALRGLAVGGEAVGAGATGAAAGGGVAAGVVTGGIVVGGVVLVGMLGYIAYTEVECALAWEKLGKGLTREALRRLPPPPKHDPCLEPYKSCLHTPLADKDFGNRCYDCYKTCRGTPGYQWPGKTWGGKPCDYWNYPSTE